MYTGLHLKWNLLVLLCAHVTMLGCDDTMLGCDDTLLGCDDTTPHQRQLHGVIPYSPDLRSVHLQQYTMSATSFSKMKISSNPTVESSRKLTKYLQSQDYCVSIVYVA